MDLNRMPIPGAMAGGMSDAMLARLSTHVASHMGLHFPRAKWHDLERAFSSAARELGFQDPRECANRFLTTPISQELVESMAGYLTVGETYFFRENRSFEIVTEEILPAIIRKRLGGEQRLRIWSAGCATGEEPYSMAILLHRMENTLKEWNICILATDINPKALRKARAGIYTGWSFRNPPDWLKKNYFKKGVDGTLTIRSSIKKMVDFSSLNLVADFYPSLPSDTNAMDVIFCRNVLMYFTPELAGKVVERFHRSLVEGGWLIVSPCEASHIHYPGFKTVNFRDATFFRKEGPAAMLRVTNGSQPEVLFSPSPCSLSQPPPTKVPAPPLEALAVLRPFIAVEQTDFEEALVLYERGFYQEAEIRLAPLLVPNQESIRANVLLCRIRANQGRLDEALILVDAAIAADKIDPGLHYLRAMIFQEQGEDHEAGASLRRALYLDQKLVLAHVAQANLAMRQGRPKEFQKHLENALSILGEYQPDEIIPESEGMTAGRLMKSIRAMDVMGDRHER
jgi:chemotaxis protein methyltransferase CheR